MACPIEPGLVVKTDRVDHKRIPLPLANRVPHPRLSDVFGMFPAIRIDLAHKVVVLEQHNYAARDLNNLHRKRLEIDSRHTGGKTSDRVARSWIHGVVCLRERSWAVPGLVGLEFRLSPRRHGRYLGAKSVKCVCASAGWWMLVPHPRQVRRGGRSLGLCRSRLLRSLSE